MSYSPRHDTGKSASAAADVKKKRIIIYSVIGVLIAVFVVALVFTVVSGIGGSGSSSTVGTRHDVTINPNGGTSGGELEGLWKLDDITSYEFDGTGRGILHTAKDFPFAYSAENGVLSIDYDNDDGNDNTFGYSVEGIMLTLTRGEKTYQLFKETK